jgi:Mn2+/Fe2+ NRAMP family transporter
MAASVRLVFPQIPIIVVTVSLAAFILAAEILVPYERYVRILKYLTLSLFAYVITALTVGDNAVQIFLSSIIPHVEFTKEYAMMFVAIFGTTVSPYPFFLASLGGIRRRFCQTQNKGNRSRKAENFKKRSESNENGCSSRNGLLHHNNVIYCSNYCWKSTC